MKLNLRHVSRCEMLHFMKSYTTTTLHWFLHDRVLYCNQASKYMQPGLKIQQITRWREELKLKVSINFELRRMHF